MIRSNASQVMRQLSKISSVELMRRCGSAIKDEIEDAFDELLEETAQYTGSTVASYRIGLGAGVILANRALKTPMGATAAMAGLKAAGEAARTAAPVVGKAVESIASKSGAALTPIIERSPNDVKQDYKSGKITREQALKELRENHGFK